MRNKFTAFSIPIALWASIIGIIFFAPYLLFLVWKEQGDRRAVLVGAR
jgi:hypothetical protein